MSCHHQAQAKLSRTADLKCKRCGHVGRFYPCGFGRAQLIWHDRFNPPSHAQIMRAVEARQAGQLSAIEEVCARGR